MSAWTRVARTEVFPPGSSRMIEVEGARIAVFNVDGNYYAIEDLCTHDNGDLAGGEVKGCEIVCPRHGARFDLRTGAVTAPPAYEPVAVFPVRIEDGWIEVRDDRWD